MKSINFTEEMHCATVNELKEMTRRIAKYKGQPIPTSWSAKAIDGKLMLYDNAGNFVSEIEPRYQVGEKVYLKEPYVRTNHTLYKWSEDENTRERLKSNWENNMPEKYARYFIEITAVHCERLQDISDEDCLKEGVCLDFIETDYFHYNDDQNRYYCADCEEKGRERLIKEALEYRERFGFDDESIDDEWIKEELDHFSSNDDSDNAKICDVCKRSLSVYKNGVDKERYLDPREAFAALIDKVYKKGTWEENPFVWVYEFKLVK